MRPVRESTIDKDVWCFYPYRAHLCGNDSSLLMAMARHY